MYINFLDISDTMMVIKNFLSDQKIIIITMLATIVLSTLIGNIRARKKKKDFSYTPKQNDPVLSNQNNIANKEELQQIAYNLFTEIRLAKMNFDINKIRSISTDSIYNLYKTQIETLQKNKQKNIVEHIKYVNSYITNLNTTNSKQVINLRIIIECFDYVIDNKRNVVKGKYNRKVLQTYEMEFVNNNSNYIIQKLQLLYEKDI